MKRNSSVLFLMVLLAFMLTSCDEGRIYEDEYVPDTSGRVMKFTATISGMESWPRGYNIVLAGFEGDNRYAEISKPVPFPKHENAPVEMVMTGIPSNVTTLRLCVINRLREMVHSYVEADCGGHDTIRVDGGSVDVNMYDAIQNRVFNSAEYTCTACHGLTKPAGGVCLLKGKSYASLLNVQSGVAGQDTLLVKPGKAEESSLFLILGTPYGKHLKYNHSNILINSYADIAMIKEWINYGAKE